MKRILILEDNVELAQYYSRLVINQGFKSKYARNSTEFFKLYYDFQPSVILLDIKLTDSKLNGLEVFEKLIKKGPFKAKVIVISGEASRGQIAQVMKLGAYTFIEKTGDFNVDKFISDILSAYHLKKQEDTTEELLQTKKNLTLTFLNQYPFIGESKIIREVKKKIKRFAEAGVDVMILGDTGTGKEVVAHHLYWQSKRAGKPFIKLNAGGLPADIIDSELFGHKRGSFTDAKYDKKGYFEQANGGCLFLDEISSITLPIQAKILRAIENKEIRIVGGEQKKVNVQLLFASNKNFELMIEEGAFREDLYYRVARNTIYLPPLVERENDIVLLMNFFCTLHRTQHEGLLNYDLHKVRNQLLSYNWPGNVRELSSFCENLLIRYDIIDNSVIEEELGKKISGTFSDNEDSMNKLLQIEDINQAKLKFEMQYIRYHLDRNNNKLNNTAKKIGLDRTTLYRKLKKIDDQIK